MLALAALAGCAADPHQARICDNVAKVFAEPGGHVEIVETTRAENPDYDVRVVYWSYDSEGNVIERSLACAFAGGTFGPGRFALTAVATSHHGRLSPMEMFWLRRVLALPTPRRPIPGDETTAAPGDRVTVEVLYFLQQSINAVILGAVYALVAISFSLVYGIIRRINFAFGEIYMIGAICTVLWTVFFGAIGGAGLWAALLAILVLATATSGLYGWATARLVFQPLRGVGGHAPLIAAIGLSIFLQEYVRLLQSPRDFWLRQGEFSGIEIASAGGFSLYASPKQAGVLIVTALTYLALSHILSRTAFGRAQRACADDVGLAELTGVDVGRTVAGTFAIGGLCAGIGGFLIVEYYGVANFFMGLMIGFKALTAAIIGGIGSVTGAVWGAMILAALEVYWSAYLAIEWKDVAAFGLLILILIFRPDGLLGVPKGRGD
jgi:branched-chain amino acid transport system permease protein